MRAIVADDHPLYREAVRLRLERAFPAIVVDEACGLDELFALGAGSAGPVDLILLDLRMPGMEGSPAIERVVEMFPSAAVVLMSGLASAEDVRSAVRAGARGFLPKTMAPELFASAISLIIGGGSYVPAEVLHAIETETGAVDTPSITGLTPREQQVLVRLAAGAQNKEIGRDLGLAEVTVKLHVRQILRKIGARNRSEAASLATRAGLI